MKNVLEKIGISVVWTWSVSVSYLLIVSLSKNDLDFWQVRKPWKLYQVVILIALWMSGS